MYNLVIFCKTYKGDLDRFKILKNSIDKYNVDNIPFFIVCPFSDIEIIKRSVVNNNEKYIIQFVAEEDVLKVNNINYERQDWYIQQIVKLGFYKLNLCEFYAVFDSDNYFIQNFYIKDFMYSNTIPYFYIKQDLRNLPKLTDIKKYFQRSGLNYDFIYHGQVFSKKVLESLESEILIPNNYNWKHLIDICPYEYNWYGEYYLKYSNNQYHYTGSRGKVFWFQREYVEARNKGLTVQDFIDEGYIYICLNNGWVKDSIYKPRFDYKFIQFKNVVYDLINERDNSNLIKKLSKILKWMARYILFGKKRII